MKVTLPSRWQGYRPATVYRFRGSTSLNFIANPRISINIFVGKVD
jgi:hypothetical protein